MDIPYGFDCFAFQREEIKYYKSNLYGLASPFGGAASGRRQHLETAVRTMAPIGKDNSPSTTRDQTDYVKFTRKNEDYPRDQLLALARANRLNTSELDKRIFCGIKIQIGIGVITNFLRKGLQYKAPIRGHSQLLANGSWTGIMRGLTGDSEAPASYDLALGNFLAWDEEFPHIKFGPFFAVESKLVFLTGGSRRIEFSTFGTNVTREIWLTIFAFLAGLALLAAAQTHWWRPSLMARTRRAPANFRQVLAAHELRAAGLGRREPGVLELAQQFFFIYLTMLLNKPSLEFDDLVWPRSTVTSGGGGALSRAVRRATRRRGAERMGGRTRRRLPTSIRALSYLWSAACLVLASIFSGEMLAVMLLHTDQNIDTIAQLIGAKPRIEPVIRQDDFTYQLMLKSLDENMLKLHNMTRMIPRADVYTRQFIESVSERKVALLGDDELIETIYDLYHKYYPLYKSKVSYLQYPISIMYRKDLDSKLEARLRRGMVQIFEMGLIHRWYQAQKETYIQFYDTFERNKTSDKSPGAAPAATTNSDSKYKPLSIHHFSSFYRAMLYCALFALAVLLLEIVHAKIAHSGAQADSQSGVAAVFSKIGGRHI